MAASVAPAVAQTAFLPRMVFRLGGEHLSHQDERFVWEANFGSDIDIVDYGAGRLTFEANYQVVLGEEIRIFDPNQGNYVLAGAASARMAGVEVSGVLYHQSRHLADRPKQPAVDWNMLGGRIRGEMGAGRVRVLGSADLRRTILRSFVDYQWEFDTRVRAWGELRPRVALLALANVRVLGVDGSHNRGTQTGARGEVGVQFEGDAGALELFVAVERRIDPVPLEFSGATWLAVGFRLVSPDRGL
jgi:hypothetical protein